jgi:nitrogen regulatory protein PII
MKMVMISYNEALESDVMEKLQAAGVENYTQWMKVRGKGRTAEPHLGSTVWPKYNTVIMTAVDDDRVAALLAGVRELRKKLGREGIKAFVLPLEQVT